MRDFRSDTRASFRNFDLLIALDRYESFAPSTSANCSKVRGARDS